MVAKYLEELRRAVIQFYKFVDNISSIKDFVGILIFIGIAVVWLLGVDKRTIKKCSMIQINKLENNKKYIRGLFIELNECKEYLRYFANREKWKKRLVKEYNALFSDYYGYLLKEAFEKKEASFTLSASDSLDSIIQTITQTKSFLCDLIHGNKQVPERYEDSIVLFQIYSNKYDELLNDMLIKAQMMKKTYCVLVGSAGNGKTNMLCSFSEMLMKLKKRCVYINGKEIEGDVDDYIWNKICSFKFLNKVFFKDFYYLFLKIRKQELFIVIDAINENEKDIGDSLIRFINKMQKFYNIRILISCRSEYFQIKFKEILVDNIAYEPVCIDLLNSKYGVDAMNRLFNVYSKAFKYSGIISELVKEKLCKQLLAMRIFFEVNENTNKDYEDLNTYSLIQEYIAKISRDNNTNVEGLLFEIADKMINENSYNEVKYSLLSNEGKRIQKIIEDTLLISNTIVVNEGRLHKDCELAVQFIYDEVRDYCLARSFLKKTIDIDERINEQNLKVILDKLVYERAVCAEGVIKYIYRDSHNIKNNSICKMILSDYADKIESNYKIRNYCLSWTLQLIFDNTDELLKCENEYIDKTIKKHDANEMGYLFSFLVKQEKISGKYTLDIILNKLREILSMELVRKIVSSCTFGWGKGIISHDDFIDIDRYLEKNNKDGMLRFREFVLLYYEFFDWDNKKELEEYIKNKDIKVIEDRIYNNYKFLMEV